MFSEHSYCIFFSGIRIRFILPTSVNLPQCITALLCEDSAQTDAEYRVQLIDKPLELPTLPIHTDGNSQIFVTNQGRLRVYSPLTEKDGCQVACLLRSDGKNILYYPSKKWDRYREYWHCSHLLWGEMLLLNLNSFLLHSSVVLKDDRIILFCGQSGAGKSTQAKLWEEFADAEVINGDRCVITNKNGIFYGGGSIWSGTSHIYSPKQAPIAGIFALKQGKENKVRKLNAEAFSTLYTQITLNTWDEEFMRKVTDNLQDMLCSVPVWELTCDISKEAVSLAYKTVFSKELP